MESRQLGTGGPQVPAFGLGCMRMSNRTTAADEAESIATIRAALDAGVTLLDTGDFYGSGHNEGLIGRALSAGGRKKAVLSVKFGALTDPGGNFVGMDGRPQAVKNYLTYSLRRLGTDHVDIYRPGRLDPTVPIEDTIGAIAEMVQAGHVRAIGLSEVGSETIRRAHAVHPIADLQVEYSLFSRGIEGGVLDTCRELGIAVTAYGVLSYGLLSGNWTRQGPTSTDLRALMPRFQDGNVESNLKLVQALHEIADARGATAAQLAIAWVLAQGRERGDIVAVVGSRTRQQLDEALPAAGLVLTEEELAAIEQAVPVSAVAGDRGAPGMKDGER
ncbi:aldo/keto reductase [Streptomyces sp. NBC_00445]|uniref:aldo/keto reductase n=1 Tax=Streptomyces sp. NBC_00445 TaxID=2975745 RepID=UPI002E1EEB97